MNSLTLKKKIVKFAKTPGVYIFRDKSGEILYIGKAASLRSRVGSYFSTPLNPPLVRGEGKGGRSIEAMIDQVADIETQKTDSVLEALILEVHLIKKYQPKYNAMGKDDKSFAYFVITKEEFPRVLILRKTDLFPPHPVPLSGTTLSPNRERGLCSADKIFGPYTSRKQMEIALKIIRKVFPFHSIPQKTEKGCLDFQIGTCSGPYAGEISKEDYRKNIRGIKMILEGKKKSLVKRLETEMREYSKKHEYEKAADVRNKLYALKHIQDIALIARDDKLEIGNWKLEISRIEAYDISNISGKWATGSMVVFTDGQVDKSEYRKFKIRTIKGIDDVGMLKEVLLRRLRHKEWPLPDLIFVDGGIPQFNGAKKILEEESLKIPVVALAKGSDRKGEKIFSSIPIKIDINFIKAIRDEAHRFAIWYHRQLRRKGLLA